MVALVLTGFRLDLSPMPIAEMLYLLEVVSAASGNCDADTLSDEDVAFAVLIMTAGVPGGKAQELSCKSSKRTYIN
jgi:hypothetical protein